LTTQLTYIRQARFPAPAPPTRRTVEALAALENWRNAGAAAAAVTGAALPLALSAPAAYRAGIVCALVVGALVALVAQLVRECRLRTLVIHPEFAQLPSVARRRRRLVRRRSRRALARWLRDTAATTQPPTRFDISPVLRDRVADVRADLCELASTLQQHRDPDPACVALLRELLRDGASPLYNPNVPAADLQLTLARVRIGLIPTNKDGGDARCE
jgi:hypothetical protein